MGSTAVVYKQAEMVSNCTDVPWRTPGPYSRDHTSRSTWKDAQSYCIEVRSMDCLFSGIVFEG